MRSEVALLFAFALVPSLVFAGPAIVTSGEHSNFTRLVLQFDGPVSWQVGRSQDGYVLRIQDQKPVYDMAKAFDLIGNSRIATLKSDPATGDMHFGIACACYAMPFEFRPGIVVVDLYDGKPPKGSSFEEPLDHEVPPVEVPATNVPPPNVPSYDWTTVEGGGLDKEPKFFGSFAHLSTDLNSVDTGLVPLRQSLIEEMGRGASQGIVDMAIPKKSTEESHTENDPSVRIHLGETPDLIVRQKGESGPPLTSKGAECISNERLDVPLWGSSGPIADQIGPERQGLTGEFDKPNPEAVTRAVRFLLFLGFGVEARGMVRAFPEDLPDKAIWNSMARILDEEPDPGPVFIGMEDCATAAAMWAALANSSALPNDEVGKSALVRSFSALPPHLRWLLGPRLVERFLEAKDISMATTLRDAVMRAPGDAGPAVILMQAAMSREAGDHAEAQAHLEPLANSPGPASAEALVAMVEHRVTLGQSVDYGQVQALEEYLKERSGGPEAARFQHALVLARAASGDFDGAFTEMKDLPDVEALLWRVLGQSGPDSALLDHATFGQGDPSPLVEKQDAALIADRLLTMGLADQAAQWLKLDDRAPALLRARVDLAQGNPNRALALLTTDDTPAALAVKARALQDLNDEKAAAEVFGQMGKPDEQWAALSRSREWGAIAEAGPEPWKALALIVTTPPPEAGLNDPTAETPLARNKALLEGSFATRDAIMALLNSVKAPVQPTQ